MSKLICPICKKEVKIGIWHDAVKRDNKCYVISGEVNWNGEDFALDDLIEKEISKIKDFDIETEDLILMSDDPKIFSREEIDNMNFGEEDLGATCMNCNSYL